MTPLLLAAVQLLAAFSLICGAAIGAHLLNRRFPPYQPHDPHRRRALRGDDGWRASPDGRRVS